MPVALPPPDRLDKNVVLDIAPTGDYVNYSTASLEAPGHCFRGVATVAGVLPSPGPSVDLLYLFDRGYSACIFDGAQVNYQLLTTNYYYYVVVVPSIFDGAQVNYQLLTTNY